MSDLLPSPAPRRNPAQVAALISLLAPFVAVSVNATLRGWVIRGMEATPRDFTPAFVSLAVFGTIIMAGLCAGVLSLCLIYLWGKEGVVGKAAFGLAVGGVLFVGTLTPSVRATVDAMRGPATTQPGTQPATQPAPM